MYKIKQTVLILFILIFLNAPFIPSVCAQMSGVIVTEPDVREILIGAEPKEIKIKVRTDRMIRRFEWRIQGPGNLSGAGSEIIYILPDHISEPKARALITAILIYDTGETESREVSFTLINPEAAESDAQTDHGEYEQDSEDDPILFDDPVSEQDPEIQSPYDKWEPDEAGLPDEQPETNPESDTSEVKPDIPAKSDEDMKPDDQPDIPAKSDEDMKPDEPDELESDGVEEMKPEEPLTSDPSPLTSLLKQGDEYFREHQFTTPEGKNAFDIFKKVLAKYPENTHAREKIYEIMNTYHVWGKKADGNNNFTRAKTYYQRYLLVSTYIVNALGDPDVEAMMREVHNRLRELNKSIQSAAKLIREADNYFNQGQFTTPEQGNAFDIYKRVLDLYPDNRLAREKLRELMKACQSRADEAYKYKRDAYKEAMRFYQEYLVIARYALNIPGAQPNELELWKAQNRVEELEGIVIANQLNHLETELSGNFGKYKKLRDEEEQGANVSKEIALIIETILKELNVIESLYEKLPERGPEISEKIGRIRKTRTVLEKERSLRMSR